MQGSNYQVDKEPLLSIPLPNPKNILEAHQQTPLRWNRKLTSWFTNSTI